MVIIAHKPVGITLNRLDIPRYQYKIEEMYDEEPCLLGVRHCLLVARDWSCLDSDVDFYGYREIEFDVLRLDGSLWAEADAEVAKDRDLRRYYEEIIAGELGWTS
jgi:hypothetical protein